jgi:hypothetical protein
VQQAPDWIKDTNDFKLSSLDGTIVEVQVKKLEPPAQQQDDTGDGEQNDAADDSKSKSKSKKQDSGK